MVRGVLDGYFEDWEIFTFEATADMIGFSSASEEGLTIERTIRKVLFTDRDGQVPMY
jgi:hypothetical protein